MEECYKQAGSATSNTSMPAHESQSPPPHSALTTPIINHTPTTTTITLSQNTSTDFSPVYSSI